MLSPYEPPDIQKVSSSYVFSFSVHRFSKIDDKMPNFWILTTSVKSTGKYNRGRSTNAREIVQSLNIFQARTLKFGMNRLHPYLGKVTNRNFGRYNHKRFTFLKRVNNLMKCCE